MTASLSLVTDGRNRWIRARGQTERRAKREVVERIRDGQERRMEERVKKERKKLKYREWRLKKEQKLIINHK